MDPSQMESTKRSPVSGLKRKEFVHQKNSSCREKSSTLYGESRLKSLDESEEKSVASEATEVIVRMPTQAVRVTQKNSELGQNKRITDENKYHDSNISCSQRRSQDINSEAEKALKAMRTQTMRQTTHTGLTTLDRQKENKLPYSQVAASLKNSSAQSFATEKMKKIRTAKNHNPSSVDRSTNIVDIQKLSEIAMREFDGL